MKSAAASIASLARYNEIEDLNEVTSVSRVLLAFLLTAFLLCVSVLYFIPVPMVVPTAGKAWVSFIALSLVFTLINLYMLNQPMGMRHGM